MYTVLLPIFLALLPILSVHKILKKKMYKIEVETIKVEHPSSAYVHSLKNGMPVERKRSHNSGDIILVSK